MLSENPSKVQICLAPATIQAQNMLIVSVNERLNFGYGHPYQLMKIDSLYFSNGNRYIAEVYLIGWLSVTSQARFFPNNKKVFVFSKE